MCEREVVSCSAISFRLTMVAVCSALQLCGVLGVVLVRRLEKTPIGRDNQCRQCRIDFEMRYRVRSNVRTLVFGTPLSRVHFRLSAPNATRLLKWREPPRLDALFFAIIPSELHSSQYRDRPSGKHIMAAVCFEGSSAFFALCPPARVFHQIVSLSLRHHALQFSLHNPCTTIDIRQRHWL